jgi:membrane protein
MRFQNKFLRIIYFTGKSFGEDLVPQKAAALSYATLLAMVPITALLVLYFKMAGKLEALSDSLDQWIFKIFVAESAQNASKYIDRMILNIHTRSLGLLGVIGLILSVYFALRTVERSINEIWKIKKHRSIFSRFKILAYVLFLTPAFMILSVYLSGKLQGGKLIHPSQGVSNLGGTWLVLLPFFLSAFTFFLINQVLPNTKVEGKLALISALISSTLFESAKFWFNLYFVHVLSANKVFGALALFPLLLGWIFLSWLIILIGVELTFILQNYTSLQDTP